MYLDGVDEVLCVRLELPFALFQLVRAGGHHTAGTNGSLGHISITISVTGIQARTRYAFLPACNGKQIAGNRNRLVKSVQLVARLGGH